MYQSIVNGNRKRINSEWKQKNNRWVKLEEIQISKTLEFMYVSIWIWIISMFNSYLIASTGKKYKHSMIVNSNVCNFYMRILRRTRGSNGRFFFRNSILLRANFLASGANSSGWEGTIFLQVVIGEIQLLITPKKPAESRNIVEQIFSIHVTSIFISEKKSFCWSINVLRRWEPE